MYNDFYYKLLFSVAISERFLFMSSKMNNLNMFLFKKYLLEKNWYSKKKKIKLGR